LHCISPCKAGVRAHGRVSMTTAPAPALCSDAQLLAVTQIRAQRAIPRGMVAIQVALIAEPTFLTDRAICSYCSWASQAATAPDISGVYFTHRELCILTN
jgi:hypothetical protein